MTRLMLAAFAALLLCTACGGDNIENAFEDLANDIAASLRAGYNFDVCSDAEAELTACNTCCADASFDSGAVFDESECGCTTTVSDDVVCAESSTDLETCTECCTNADFSGASRSGFDEPTCTCFDNSDQPRQ